MDDWEFSAEDLEQIRMQHLTPGQITGQLDKFRKGTTPVKLLRPCIPEDGIICPSEAMKRDLIACYDAAGDKLDILKFVPASGAATRMFKDWFRLLDQESPAEEEAVRRFSEALGAYAFSAELKALLKSGNIDMDECLRQGRVAPILTAILFEKGLNYGHLPKALLKFHRYPQGGRTALQEHFVEAAAYARSRGSLCRLHFTVSEEFLDPVWQHIQNIVAEYEANYGVSYRVDLSIQQSSTDTIAVDMDNRPFRDEQRRLVFRPAGHGALLHNLNELPADIVFIKNIDNVSHDRLLEQAIPYKKVLAGCLLMLQERIFGYLETLSEKDISLQMIEEIEDYCCHTLGLDLPESCKNLPVTEKSTILFARLNRPIRICGMVKNTGEPGGGPFWIEDKSGEKSKQIIEQFQVHGADSTQMTRWSASTHFNPVDLACGVRDYRGRKFNLLEYADQDAVCISVKSEKGRSLKALELPGLWNGAMAGWITIFIEVPIVTFNPVKTVEDLLRKEHLPA